ncbi:hypothetical protein IFM89_008087 [Coptis chinensis]|uniref:Protein kinase domain-containing protein n=1 Tax=Coptis chinensis TaxID=261450 RepID=A0A835IVH1_9MAGN|nr:hypothetical protein IFM89_008087 [Coptis chinensis]
MYCVGLSKLIEKDQSEFMTTMRGTPGYLAPEWLNSVITEKVDVYIVLVVALEIVCGLKNLDSSQAEENMHLLSLLKIKAEADLLYDIVDKHNEDMFLHRKEAKEMIKVVVWCLQSNFMKRPSCQLL